MIIATQHQYYLEQRKERLERKLGYAVQSVMYLKDELRKVDSRIETYKLKQALKDSNFKHQYLDKYIFQGLINQNDGFDPSRIKYFNETDFEIVLNRVKEKGLGLYGIECFKDGQFFDIDTFERYYTYPQDTNWFFTSFERLRKMDTDFQYSASYYIPGNAFL